MKATKIAAVALITLSSMTLGMTAFAEDTGIVSPGSVPTKTQVIITAGDDAVGTDPENPTPGGETGQTGNLTIDHASILNFGSMDSVLSGADRVLKHQADKVAGVAVDPNVQVTDKSGKGLGWILKVKQSKALQFLDGADIVVLSSTIYLPSEATTSVAANEPLLPTAKKLSVTDQDQEIMSAVKGKGMGTYLVNFKSEETTLTVDPGAIAGVYEGELTWTLSSGGPETE